MLHLAPFLGWYREYAMAKQLGGDFTNQTDLSPGATCIIMDASLTSWASSMCYDNNNAT